MNNAIVQLNQTMEKNNLMPVTYALDNIGKSNRVLACYISIDYM
jgi:hypothetical protein